MDDLIKRLITVADELYVLPPGEFTAARTQRAKTADDPSLAKRIAGLRKPSTAAWASNLLVRTDPDLADQIVQVGAALRAAFDKGHGPELVKLRRERRGTANLLGQRAAELARDEGVPLSEQMREQVVTIVAAAILDEQVGAAFRTGLLLTVLDANGVDQVDVAPAVAVPEALGLARPSPAGDPVSRRRGRMHVVPDSELAKRVLQEARRNLAEVDTQLRENVERLAGFDDELARHEAATLQANAELDELQRQIAEVEQRLDWLAEQVIVATGLRAGVEEDHDRLTAELAEAQAAVDRAERGSE